MRSSIDIVTCFCFYLIWDRRNLFDLALGLLFNSLSQETKSNKKQKTEKNSIPVIFDWFTGNFKCVSIQSTPYCPNLWCVPLVSPEKCQLANRNDKQHANLSDLAIYPASKHTHDHLHIMQRPVYISLHTLLVFKSGFYCYVSYSVSLFFTPTLLHCRFVPLPAIATTKFHARWLFFSKATTFSGCKFVMQICAVSWFWPIIMLYSYISSWYLFFSAHKNKRY